MITDEEMKRALDLNVVIVPFKAYSSYNDEGNLSEEDYLGVKFIAHRYDNEAVFTKEFFCLMVDEIVTDITLVGETPTEALDKYEEWYKRHYPEGTWVA